MSLYREAVAEDVAELTRLWVLLRTEEREYYSDLDNSPLRGLEEMSRALQSGTTYLGVLEGETGLKGFIHCDVCPKMGRSPKTGVVHSCYAEPSHRRLHKTIWAEVEQWAETFGILRLQFQTLVGNKYMERFASTRARPVSVTYEMNLPKKETTDGRRRKRSLGRDEEEVGLLGGEVCAGGGCSTETPRKRV